MYAFELCAAISDDFRNSPEMAAHDLNTYIFTFTKIGLLSPQFSVQRPAFLKAVFQCESFDVGLIRVGESPKVRVMVLSRLIHLSRTPIKHCVGTIIQVCITSLIWTNPICFNYCTEVPFFSFFSGGFITAIQRPSRDH